MCDCVSSPLRPVLQPPQASSKVDSFPTYDHNLSHRHHGTPVLGRLFVWVSAFTECTCWFWLTERSQIRFRTRIFDHMIGINYGSRTMHTIRQSCTGRDRWLVHWCGLIEPTGEADIDITNIQLHIGENDRDDLKQTGNLYLYLQEASPARLCKYILLYLFFYILVLKWTISTIMTPSTFHLPSKINENQRQIS